VARSIAGSLTVMAAFSILLSAAPNVPVAVVAVAVVAMANAPFNIAYTTARQTLAPGDLTGRLFALTGGIGSGAFLLGSLGGGLLADAASARTAIAVSTGCLIIAAIGAISLWRTENRPADVDERTRAAVI
jgi:MFS family permease